jgi:uncharacterized membrane protein YeaQ/YmgE (transglycosylase-associated protein family)
MGILPCIVIGLFAGCIAKWIMPWAPGGIILAILLGIGGAFTGGMLGTTFGFEGMAGFDIRSLMIALGGAIILLTGYGLMVNRMTA